MSKLWVLLECETDDKSYEASQLFGHFANWGDTMDEGPKETQTVYCLHSIGGNTDAESDSHEHTIATILGWCMASLNRHLITHFQLWEDDDSPQQTRVVYIAPDNLQGKAHAYTMSLNDDNPQLVPEPGDTGRSWRAPHDTLEEKLRASWPDALFVSQAEIQALVTRCGCGKPVKNILSQLCVECDQELIGGGDEEMNDNQSVMYTDYVGSRMGQKLDLQQFLEV